MSLVGSFWRWLGTIDFHGLRLIWWSFFILLSTPMRTTIRTCFSAGYRVQLSLYFWGHWGIGLGASMKTTVKLCVYCVRFSTRTSRSSSAREEFYCVTATPLCPLVFASAYRAIWTRCGALSTVLPFWVLLGFYFATIEAVTAKPDHSAMRGRFSEGKGTGWLRDYAGLTGGLG